MAERPSIGNTVAGILDEFRRLDRVWCGRNIVEALLVGDGRRFRWQGDRTLGVAVGDIGIRDATDGEYDLLEEGIALGQVQIYRMPLWSAMGSREQVVLHQATGHPLDPDGPEARRQQARWARAGVALP